MTRLTLGSLFDGSGGFPLAGKIVGITPIWASEIEPFPIRVTTKRIPEMRHYGNILKINGAEIEPVDIITFGSPCQDVSMAGKRKGLEGSRSGLFYEAVRIIKEMRKETNGKYPRFAVWENVPGALSSNGGEDFRAVLEALCSIKESVYVPRPKRWTPAGEIVGNGFSIAWRILDAQYWGVPQRRRRIFLIADFGSEGAREILFECQGLSGNSSESVRAWKNVTGRTEGGVGISSAGWSWQNSLKTNGPSYQKELSPTIRAYNVPAVALDFNPTDSRISISKNDKSQTLLSRMGTGGNQVPLLMTFGIGGYNSRGMLSDNPLSGFYRAETSKTIDCNGGNPCAHQGGVAVVEKVTPVECDRRYMIRRLTPMECARLQGFPDYWCDDLGIENPTTEELEFWNSIFKTVGKNKTEKQLRKWLKNPRSDMAEYKMWGNGIALPCVVFVLFGIVSLVNQKEE